MSGRPYDACIDYVIARDFGGNATAWAYHFVLSVFAKEGVYLFGPDYIDRILARYRGAQ